MKLLAYTLLFSGLLLTSGCNKTECNPKENANCICTLEYDPVCGCDGKTYGNACAADCANVSYTKGEC